MNWQQEESDTGDELYINSADTQCNDNIIITQKRRGDVVLT